MEERVLVLVEEAVDAVRHITGVMSDAKINLVPHVLVGRFQLSGSVVIVLFQLPVHSLQEKLVGNFLGGHFRGVVHDRQYPFVGSLD